MPCNRVSTLHASMDLRLSWGTAAVKFGQAGVAYEGRMHRHEIQVDHLKWPFAMTKFAATIKLSS